MEPYKIRRWRRRSAFDPITFFTCARPGRSYGSQEDVQDEDVDKWVAPARWHGDERSVAPWSQARRHE